MYFSQRQLFDQEGLSLANPSISTDAERPQPSMFEGTLKAYQLKVKIPSYFRVLIHLKIINHPVIYWSIQLLKIYSKLRLSSENFLVHIWLYMFVLFLIGEFQFGTNLEQCIMISTIHFFFN